MKETVEIVQCPKCGKPIPALASQGVCPQCALAAVAAPTEAGQPAQTKPAPPPLEAVAEAFPQLEILELIGAGGMGCVYKARQPKLDRCVALKILPQGLAGDPAFAERFSREARLLARLNHPGIVSVHDYGESGGFFFLLMEFVDGVNLRQAMRAGRFSPPQALALVPKICEALQFAHDEGILHRDVKPENILLDTRGRLKIADFGIAKLVGDKVKDAALTASGMVVGTPHYMAPEQLEHPHDVDQRADIYSLGVVFYEMLTGELPIGRFAPPSQKSPVDPRVDAVVLQALEKERERRQHNAAEVKSEVEQITATPIGRAGAGMSAGQPAVAGSNQAGPSGTVLLPDPKARAGATPPLTSTPIARPLHSFCYFSTPKRMRNCFPGPRAHIFQCKGELRLGPAELVFISPWRTRVVIPLKDISDLSIGQFQVWTTPWIMKGERVFFLSVTAGSAGSQRTVHLTPVREDSSKPAAVNALVAEWYEAIRQAVVTVTGASPHVSEPLSVSIRAQRSWIRRAGPLLLFAPLTAWFLGTMSLRSPFGPAPLAPWIGAVILLFLLWLKLAWFTFGLLKANQALNAGDLDAVTSDEPPGDRSEIPGDALPTGESDRTRAKRPFWWTAIAWAFIAIGILSAIDTLAGLYSRPIVQTCYPGIVHLFVGVAMLTLNRRWRLVALIGLTAAMVVGAFICTMMILSPEHGSVNFPLLNTRVPATEMPRLAATAVVFLSFVLGGPCYLLTGAKGKTLFGLTRPK